MADEQTTGRPLSDRETNDLVGKIQSVLTPDLLEPKYRKQSEGQHPTFGHCASATQAAYYMLGGKKSGYVPQVAKEDDGTTHWWLRHRQTGHVIDPTKEQYTSQGEKPPYDLGRGCGFPNPNPDAPSRRGQEIIDRISGKPFRQAKASGGSAKPYQSPEYSGSHTAPTPDSGSPMHDVTQNTYPDDFYGPNGIRYYGSGDDKIDAESYWQIQSAKARPYAKVDIYRAVPKNIKSINEGDWVTINRRYAKEHGESTLLGDYKILKKTVRARDLHTNGDSFHEWGYWPKKIPVKWSDRYAETDKVREKFGMELITRQYSTEPSKASGGPVEDQDIASPAPAEDEGITAYHGSPYEFERFDTSKIGTGSGAQAYGHGIYLAKYEPIAKKYRDSISEGMYKSGDKIFDSSELEHLNIRVAAREDLNKALERANSLLNEQPQNEIMILNDIDKINEAIASGAKKIAGNMYEVKINANPDHFLDWDKKFSNQSEYVKDAIMKSGIYNEYRKNLSNFNWPSDTRNKNMKGENLHSFLMEKLGRAFPEKTSDYLASIGIKGIKYRDDFHRYKGKIAQNYVVFDDKLLDIKRRYEMGGAVPMASGGEAGDTQSMPQLTSEQQSLLDQLSRAIDRVYPAMDAAEARQPVIRHEPTMPGEPALTREQHQEYNVGQLQNALARVPTDYPTGPIGYAEGGDVGDNPAVQKALAVTSGVPATSGAAANFIQNTSNPKRIMVPATGPGGIKGIVIPRHMWEGGNGKHGLIPGLRDINQARAAVYGSQNRDPLTIGKVAEIHKQTLDEHFKRPVDEQIARENEALERLRAAKHIGKSADTLDESEKLDTVRHEYDDQGRPHVGYGSKGIAGYALYSSGHGPNQKFHVLNVCPGSVAGCSGGIDANGIADTSRGTCFAPVAESQYPGAAIRRACHTQAKFDPAMTSDWILAHTGSLRRAAEKADKNGERVLFRPNVVDESDRSSRYAIKHLNDQRKAYSESTGLKVPLPDIIANSYGKTTELHDPDNGFFVTYSNTGPKTKLGYSVAENIQRDKQRVRSTILAQDAAGRDFVNDDGEETPPKGSYMVTDVKRDSPLDEKMRKAFKYAKYWSAGRPVSGLSKDEIAEGEEAHYDGKGKPTTPEKAHYGHITLNGKRYDYQKQHILHRRLVQVGKNKDGSPHMIPTDSRFKDEEFLPKTRYMTRSGKPAGHILITTPTTSTSNAGHQTAFTHHVNESHIEHASKNKGEYEIDPPAAQEASAGKEYVPPREAGHFASGGSVGEDTIEESMAFPEQSHYAQIHNVHRSRHNDEKEIGSKRSHGIKSIDRALRLTSQYNQPTRGRP